MKRIKHLLFDLDGTLTDPKEGITKSIEYALKKFDITVEHLDQLIPYIGPPLFDSFIQLNAFNEENAHLAVGYYRERYREQGIFENKVIPGIPELLEKLSNQGYLMYVATSKPTVFAEQIVEHYQLGTYFQHIGGSHLDGTRSRKQEVIEYVLTHNTISSEQALMIGDREHDIFGAKACGVKSVGVTFGYGSELELRDAGADYIVHQVKDFEKLITTF